MIKVEMESVPDRCPGSHLPPIGTRERINGKLKADCQVCGRWVYLLIGRDLTHVHHPATWTDQWREYKRSVG